ncbi:MAG: MarR family transcriptional regulator, partial [Rhodospirillales bacterium]|nr:MarR family transcriptional regulator [Rhodospirillales bacterium]
MAKGGAKGPRRNGAGRKSETDGEAFDLETFLPYRLSVVTNRVSRAFARRYSAEFGLSVPEWRV